MSPTIADLHRAYGEGRLGPADAVRAAYARIAAGADPGIFIHLRPEAELLAEAEALGPFDPARPLWGVPVAVKDNLDVTGLPTTAACPAFAYPAAADATVVARLRSAGALLLGKTNLDQFATGLVGTRTPWPVPRNALRADLVPGGSSSGSAVAVAHGIVPVSLGTDTAGSGRVPAALNGLLGLKPTPGLVSTGGVVPACRSLDCVSIFARTVADGWRVLEAIAGFDPEDPFSRPLPLAASALPPGLRLGVPRTADLVFAGDADSAAAFERDRSRAAALAGRTVEVELAPFFEVAKLLYEGPWVAERLEAAGPLLAREPEALHPVTRKILEGARRWSAAEAFAARHRLAELARALEPLWRRIDLLLVPSIPRPVTLAEVEADPFGPNALLGTYTNFVNLLGLCALTLPTAPRADGLPGSVTLIAPGGRDGLLAAFARRFLGEPEPPTAPPPGWIALAVVGAHLSGLPLNHELGERGAVFLEATRTAPLFRLLALPGGPPRRPGLARAGGGAGASIAVELWALPPVALADLLTRVPPPLALGSLPLADGRSVPGFVLQAGGDAGAEDVTAFGGWRAFLAANECRS
ncbi:MAG: allophanate hydrolase [Geminicoccaceae bacterium]|nr:allophanate hydrolase [Geminicoccaceae bacterium]